MKYKVSKMDYSTISDFLLIKLKLFFQNLIIEMIIKLKSIIFSKLRAFKLEDIDFKVAIKIN